MWGWPCEVISGQSTRIVLCPLPSFPHLHIELCLCSLAASANFHFLCCIYLISVSACYDRSGQVLAAHPFNPSHLKNVRLCRRNWHQASFGWSKSVWLHLRSLVTPLRKVTQLPFSRWRPPHCSSTRPIAERSLVGSRESMLLKMLRKH